jgi:hypothetical protein
MIGATAIVRLTCATAKALQQGRPDDVVEGLLARLASALTTWRDEAAPYLKRKGEFDTTDSTDGGSKADTAQLIELCALFERQDFAALAQFESMSLSLSELLGAPRIDRLRDALDILGFRQGLPLLCGARLKATQVSAPMPSESHP